MKILIWGLVIFCLALCVHLVIWKSRIPKTQTKALLQVFFTTLTVSLVLLKFITIFIAVSKNYIPALFPDYLHIGLFFSSLALAYIATYSAVEVDGPSFFIVMNIDDAGPGGLTEEKFNQIITDDYLVKPRVNDLLRDKMVYLEAGKYKLTGSGFLLARLFVFYRKLLGISRKGG